MNNLFKTSLAVALPSLLFGSGLMAAEQVADSYVEVDFEYGVSQGSHPCTIVSTPVFIFDEIEGEGWYNVYDNVEIHCDSPESDFYIMFDRSPTTTDDDIYSDEHIQVWAGVSDNYSPGNTLFLRGYYNHRYDGCVKGANSVNWQGGPILDGKQLYPAGGKKMTNYFSRNVCIMKENNDDAGVYTIPMRSVLHVKNMPEDADLDDIPSSFTLPVTLVPTFTVGGGE